LLIIASMTAVPGVIEPYSEGLDSLVAAVRVLVFVDDRCILVGDSKGGIRPISAPLGPGEHWVNTALSAAEAETGSRLLSLHPFRVMRLRPDSVVVIAWADVNPASSRAGVMLLQPDEAAERLRQAGTPEMAELVLTAAELRRQGIDDDRWFEDNVRLLEKHYLAQSDPAAQAGKLGGIESWNESRRVIADAIRAAGAFLDVGCANGLLMETVARWCRNDGYQIEPYGLDISPGLVELARRRLPQWADRIWLGNAWTWQPPRRFDFVHTRVEYVPDHNRPALVGRLLDKFVAAGGRLLITPPDYGPPDYLVAWGFRVGGEVVKERAGKGPARVAWIDKG
jgi:SAM-dependent methyltransferase